MRMPHQLWRKVSWSCGENRPITRFLQVSKFKRSVRRRECRSCSVGTQCHQRIVNRLPRHRIHHRPPQRIASLQSLPRPRNRRARNDQPAQHPRCDNNSHPPRRDPRCCPNPRHQYILRTVPAESTPPTLFYTRLPIQLSPPCSRDRFPDRGGLDSTRPTNTATYARSSCRLSIQVRPSP